MNDSIDETGIIESAEQISEGFSKYGFKAGFLKLAILKLVSQGPMHGYALMKEIERITDGDWKPSPGSIYPALQELWQTGLITMRVEGRRRIYEITPKGKLEVTAALNQVKEVLKYLNRLFEEQNK